MSAVNKNKTVNPATPIKFDVPSLPAPSGNGLPGWPYMSYTNLHSLNLDWVIAMIKAYGEYLYAVQQALLEWTGETNDLLQQLIDTVNKWGDQISYIIDKLPESTVDELLGMLATLQEHTSEIDSLIADVSDLKAADTTLGQSIDSLQQALTADINELNGLIAKADADITQTQSNLQAYVASNNAALATTNAQVEQNRQDILTLTGGAEGELARIQALETSQGQQDGKITALESLTTAQGETIAAHTSAIGNINTVNEQQTQKIDSISPSFIHPHDLPFTLGGSVANGTCFIAAPQYVFNTGDYYVINTYYAVKPHDPFPPNDIPRRIQITITGGPADTDIICLSATAGGSYNDDLSNIMWWPSSLRNGDGGLWVGYSPTPTPTANIRGIAGVINLIIRYANTSLARNSSNIELAFEFKFD